MSSNKEDLKNKIIYRASYRGSKEMDILIIEFVRSIIDKLDDQTYYYRSWKCCIY